MKVFLDERVPEKLERYLPGHTVTSVGRLGWKGSRNGRLLASIQQAEFQAFITNDKRMEYEQNLVRRPFAILLLRTNHWPTMEPHARKIAAALELCARGTLTKIDCGIFVPSRCRK